MDGKPFFMVSQAVDPGLLQVLERDIIPCLEQDVPNQPSAEQLNDLADQAAMDAANAQAQAQANVQNQVVQENAAVENVANPAEADEQNVSGM